MYLIHKYRVVRLLAKPRLPLLAKPLSGSLSGIHIEDESALQDPDNFHCSRHLRRHICNRESARLAAPKPVFQYRSIIPAN